MAGAALCSWLLQDRNGGGSHKKVRMIWLLASTCRAPPWLLQVPAARCVVWRHHYAFPTPFMGGAPSLEVAPIHSSHLSKNRAPISITLRFLWWSVCVCGCVRGGKQCQLTSPKSWWGRTRLSNGSQGRKCFIKNLRLLMWLVLSEKWVARQLRMLQWVFLLKCSHLNGCILTRCVRMWGWSTRFQGLRWGGC